MAIEDPHPQGPVISEGFVTTQLMVNLRELFSQLIGFHQPQDIPHPVSTGFDLPDHLLHPLGLSTLLFHPVEASVAHNEQEKDASPNRGGRNSRSLPSIPEGVDLLPTSYFHTVFTVPEGVRPLALRNQKVVYNLLFKSASETLTQLARDPKHLGAEIGFIAVLHTWTQTLMDHPHLHCLVPGGGLSPDGKRWVPSREDFFLPVNVLSALFRGKFLDKLKKAYEAGELTFAGQIEGLKEASAFKKYLNDLYDQEWVVYCKPPLGNPEKVMDSLGRYTHRVALSNDRLVKIEGSQVTFRWRDSADGNKIKWITLEAFEFIRRFLLHVLPDQFVKIRYYGILSHRSRKGKLLRCKRLLGALPGKEPEQVPKETWQDLLTRMTGIDPRVCPRCGKGKMIRRELLDPCSVSPAERIPPSNRHLP